ncbi:MAG: hypothetical protein VX642_03495 [Bdellovibrionota bacterium]|nr:hypothetical protein [Bdellovibrionota bacterium]
MKFLKMNAAKIAFTFLSLIYLYLWYSSLQGKYYVYSGIQTDFYIPLNFAYALETGKKIYTEFNTSFGILFGKLNQYAFQIIQTKTNNFHLSDLIHIESSLFAFGLLFILALQQCLFKSLRDIKALFISFLAITVALSVHRIDSFDHKLINWENYNHQMYALMILQFLSLIGFQKLIKKNNLQIAGISFIQALCLFVSFNYKINFFGSCSLIAFGFWLFFDNSIKIKSLICTLIFSTIIFLIPSIAWDTSLSQYIQSVLLAGKGKAASSQSHWSSYKDLIQAGIFFVILSNLVEQIFIKQIPFRIGNFIKKPFLSLAIKDTFVAAAILVATAGTSGRMTFIFHLFLAIYIFLRIDIKTHPSKLKYIPGAFLVYFAIVNTLNIGRVAQFKNKPERSHHNIAVQLINSKNWNSLYYSFEKNPGYQELIDLLGMDEVSNKDAVFLKLATKIDVMKANLPRLTNVDIFNHLQRSLQIMKKWHFKKEEKAQMLGFYNPLPVLTDSQLPVPSFNWVHLGVNFSKEQIPLLVDGFKDTNFIMFKVIPYIGHQADSALNCYFLKWNKKEGYPFSFLEADSSGAYFARATNELRQQKNKQKFFQEIEPELLNNCKRWDYTLPED